MLHCLQLLFRQGYILYVNGKWSGEILEPGQQQTTLTGFTPGNAICVQLSAISYDLPAPVPIHSNQEGAKLQHFSSRYEQPDSGIESSSSLRSKRSTEETNQYACSTGPPLVIQFSNLVKSVSSLELVKLGCRSASVTWSLDNSADRSIDPKVLTILCWKSSAEECVIKQIVTGKMIVSNSACARMLAIRALSLLASICKYYLFLPRGFHRVNSQSSHIILSTGSGGVDCKKCFLVFDKISSCRYST